MSEQSKYQVRAVFDEAVSLFERKNADYGDSWRNHGWRGNLGRILEKADRLQTTLWHSSSNSFSVSDEDARQTALDMLNTLAFFIINYEARREWGKEDSAPEPWANGTSAQIGSGSTMVTVSGEQLRDAMTPKPTQRPLRDTANDEGEHIFTHENH